MVFLIFQSLLERFLNEAANMAPATGRGFLNRPTSFPAPLNTNPRLFSNDLHRHRIPQAESRPRDTPPHQMRNTTYFGDQNGNTDLQWRKADIQHHQRDLGSREFELRDRDLRNTTKSFDDLLSDHLVLDQKRTPDLPDETPTDDLHYTDFLDGLKASKKYPDVPTDQYSGILGARKDPLDDVHLEARNDNPMDGAQFSSASHVPMDDVPYSGILEPSRNYPTVGAQFSSASHVPMDDAPFSSILEANENYMYPDVSMAGAQYSSVPMDDVPYSGTLEASRNYPVPMDDVQYSDISDVLDGFRNYPDMDPVFRSPTLVPDAGKCSAFGPGLELGQVLAKNNFQVKNCITFQAPLGWKPGGHAETIVVVNVVTQPNPLPQNTKDPKPLDPRAHSYS